MFSGKTAGRYYAIVVYIIEKVNSSALYRISTSLEYDSTNSSQGSDRWKLYTFITSLLCSFAVYSMRQGYILKVTLNPVFFSNMKKKIM